MRHFWREFEAFAVKGNAIDLAVGVVIGAAFGQVTSSLSNNIITPPVAYLLGGVAFEKLSISIDGGGSISYGLFLEAIINFIIIAFALFLFVSLFSRLTKKRKEQQQKPAENPELKVLLEIRDAVRSSKS